MSKSSKIVSGLGMLLLVCLLGAAVNSKTSLQTETKTMSPLEKFGVSVGSRIVIIDDMRLAGYPTDSQYQIREIDGWHVLCHQSSKRKVAGVNRFVFNLNEMSFQIVRQTKAK